MWKKAGNQFGLYACPWLTSQPVTSGVGNELLPARF